MIFDSLFYEYRLIGTVEKDGKRYEKYQKVPRIRRRRWKKAFLVCLGLAVLGLALQALRQLPSPAPPPDVTPVADQ